MLLAREVIFTLVITFKSVTKDGIYLNVCLISYLLLASPVNQCVFLSPSTVANKEIQPSFQASKSQGTLETIPFTIYTVCVTRCGPWNR